MDDTSSTIDKFDKFEGKVVIITGKILTKFFFFFEMNNVSLIGANAGIGLGTAIELARIGNSSHVLRKNRHFIFD